MDTAQEAPTTVILAEDEASLYLQATTQVVWYPQGQTPLVTQAPGRDSLHYYGTLNLHTGQETVMATKTMNAAVTALYLQLLLGAYPDRPLLLLWDRAPWHRGQPIQEVLAANPRLEIWFLPTAAPDLNPQEHVWKAAREAVSHNHQMAKLADLASRFERFLNETTFPCSLLDKHAYHNICPMFI
jgi:transposase